MKDGTLSVRQPCPPFCWQNKIALKHIRRNVPEAVMPNCLLVYFVLSELASDDHAAGDFRAKHSDLAKKCGLSRRTIITHLQRLESIGAISSFPNYGPDGSKLPSSIRLHGPDELKESRGVCATVARGVCAIAHGGRCTSIRKKEEVVVVSPLTPQGGKSNFPALGEVRKYAAASGIPADTADRYHAYGQAGGWRDKADKPIRNWKRALLAFAKVDGTAKAGSVASRAGSGGFPAVNGTAPRRIRKPKADYFTTDYSKGF